MTCQNCQYMLEITQKFCANCGAAVSEQMTSPPPVGNANLEDHKAKESIVEVRIERPFMIGIFSVNILFWSVIWFILGIQFAVTFIGWLIMLFSLSYFLSNLPPRVKKPCPHCRERNEYLVTQNEHICTYCQRNIKVKWE